MSFNIHHGEGLDGKVDLERIAAVIRREQADIVGLQEVDRGVERTQRRDLPAELAKLTGFNVCFERNIGHQGGDYGNAILSRFPILEKTNTHYRMLRPNEQRGIQQVILDVRGRNVLFMNTHIDYRPDDSERMSNVEEIRELIGRRAGMPVILTGDFNSTPDSRVHRTLKTFLEDSWETAGQGDGHTFSSDKPRSRIDYLWVRKDGPVKPLRLWVPQSDASDHLPLAGEFELR